MKVERNQKYNTVHFEDLAECDCFMSVETGFIYMVIIDIIDDHGWLLNAIEIMTGECIHFDDDEEVVPIDAKLVYTVG